MKKILVTGSGGIGGVNFVRALKLFTDKFFIVGTDFNKYYLQFANLDEKVISPKHSDPNFITFLNELIEKYKIDFLHPQPSSEALVISKNFDQIKTDTLLPPSNVISTDKLETQKILSKLNILVAKTKVIKNYDMIENEFNDLGSGPHWIRAKSGAGGNLSLLCNNSKEVEYWMKLWILRGKANFNDFMLQEYLPGRNIAWDSFWYNGKLILSFTRERLEYPFKHISPSGITGTPTVSKIIVEESVNKIGEIAVKSIHEKPHGNYAVDLKEDVDGNWHVTEIDSGKFHTTTPLWGYISTKFLKQDPLYNIPYLYTMMGLNEISNPGFLGNDIYPEGLHILRHIDCGTWIYKNDGFKEKVL
jgi:carbamoyl-phosphate synthase large subunit|tara:strand:+ start:3141 stop:4220 length:1080 start_codon:yes stop_codon:yes gene_type:complete